MDWAILSVTHERFGDWIACGETRAAAEKTYAEGIASGKYPRPAYRVIWHRKRRESVQ